MKIPDYFSIQCVIFLTRGNIFPNCTYKAKTCYFCVLCTRPTHSRVYWMFIMLDQLNNSPQVDIYTISCLRAYQSLILFNNAVCYAEKQQMLIQQYFNFNPTGDRTRELLPLEASTLTFTPPETNFIVSLYLCVFIGHFLTSLRQFKLYNIIYVFKVMV